MNEDYEEGYGAGFHYFNSKVFASYTRDIAGEDAIKMFKPPVQESLMMVSTPMPKDRADWIKGFNDYVKQHPEVKGEQ